MILSTQEQRFMNRIRTDAMTLLDLRDEIVRAVALYNAKDFGTTILTADFAETPGYEHYTQSDLWNVITAFEAVITALGDNVSGQSVNLIKMQG